MQTCQRSIDIGAIQKELSGAALDGWLFYSFHGSDPLAANILGLGDSHFVSRRWFYFIPVSGQPRKLLHRIELDALDSLPGEGLVYLGWKELEARLRELLGSAKTVAMQYSPNNAIPYISRVDAGTLELVRACGVQVVSSADLVQKFESCLAPHQLQSHVQAVENLRKIVFEAFARIRDAVTTGEPINEYQVQQFIWQRFAHYGMTSNSPPIVAVNEHSGSPHYQPSAEKHAPICKGDFVLLDIWAKLKQPDDAIYGDITWTGFVGDAVPEKYSRVFDIVAGARDAAVSAVKEAVSNKHAVEGWQIDDVTRRFIEERGYGQHFLHRTGHSIGVEVHGNGANIDNLETQDRRRLLPNTCFSIEPGIYLPEFGVRSEIDVYIGEAEVIVAGQPVQTEVVPLLSTALYR